MRVACVTAAYLGLPVNLVLDREGWRWSDVVPDGALTLDTVPLPGRDAHTVARLAGVELSYPDTQSATALRICGVDTAAAVPWGDCMPRWKLRQVVQDVARDVQGLLDSPDIDYYLTRFEPTRALLCALERASIDAAVYRKYASEDGRHDTLLSFKPDDAGLAGRVEYDQLRTRTGRLVVSSGPQILTLKRSQRDILRSKWSGGRVVMFDFASLEARIAAYEVGHTPPVDMYTDLSTRVLGGAPRASAKLAVLATMFGGGGGMLDGSVEPGAEAWLMDRIRSYFDVQGVTRRLRDERTASGSGSIRSAYGRRVQCGDADHIMYSSYIQATGVDVAMAGFVAMERWMRDSGLTSRPIFVLHDAMLIDMHPDEERYIDGLVDVCSHADPFGRVYHVVPKDVTA